MGQHTLHRTTGISTSTGRAIFTGAAALALLSGGTGMAFAGIADDTSASEHEKDAKDDHDDEGDHDGKDDGKDDGKGKHQHKDVAKPEACEIPIYANLVEDVDALDEDLTDDATKAANEASAAAAKPFEDAICPVIAEELNTLDEDLGAGPKDDYRYLGTSPTGLPDPHA